MEYELSSAGDLLQNRSVYHVKLTDSSLKAIEDSLRYLSNSSKPTICFTSGVITVPDGKQNSVKTFQFALSTVSNDPNGRTECIKESVSRRPNDRTMLQLGCIENKITVLANDDVYQTTREKLTLVEEESKKSCAKEIKSSDPKGKRIIKRVIKSGSQLRDKVTNSVPKVSSFEPKHEIVSSSVTPSVKPVSIHATSSVKPVSSSSLPAVSDYSLKDRMIHLLALRPYKRAELLARLMRDGLTDGDKGKINLMLEQVAQPTGQEPDGESFTLAKHMFANVRADWPFYSDLDRQLLKRRIAQETRLTKAPPRAISPVLSNHGSPLNGASLKRMSDLTSSQQSVNKKIRVMETNKDAAATSNGHASEQSTSASKLAINGQHVDTGASSDSKPLTTKPNFSQPSLSTSSSVNVSNGANETMHDSSKSSDDATVPDYVLKYVAIANDDQRQQYKNDFTLYYSEYMKLHNELSNTAQKFEQLKRELQATHKGSGDYATVKNKVMHEYKREKSDERFALHRKRFHYLHAKLNHIKMLITDYDKQKL